MLWWAEESSDRAGRHEAHWGGGPGDDWHGRCESRQENSILWVCNSLYARVIRVKYNT